MVFATFNVNSVRARLPVLTKWLEEVSPDVVALQETKVEDHKFPLAEIEELGYKLAIHGQPKYNGVALLSKLPMEDVQFGYQDSEWIDDCRIAIATINGVAVVNTYVPNGSSVGSEKYVYKLAWFRRFARLIQETVGDGQPAVWMGDINVAPTDLDVFEPAKMVGQVCFSDEEKAALQNCKDWGWTDCFREFESEGGHFSYWEYFLPNGFKRNLGWRIDHIYASPSLLKTCKNCWIDKDPRSWERPSDHTPVLAEFDI